MKTVSAIACLLALVGVAHSDELITTSSGRKVILKDDGTWIYAEKPAASGPIIDANTDVDKKIHVFCKGEWQDDFDMLSYCIKKQKAALAVLALGKPADVLQDQFISVRQRCASEWANDFDMREYCEKKQFSAIRELRQ